MKAQKPKKQEMRRKSLEMKAHKAKGKGNDGPTGGGPGGRGGARRHKYALFFCAARPGRAVAGGHGDIHAYRALTAKWSWVWRRYILSTGSWKNGLFGQLAAATPGAGDHKTKMQGNNAQEPK